MNPLANCYLSWVSYFVFYSVTSPLISILHAALDLTLHLATLADPIYVLVGSVIFVCGWAAQMAFWTEGDLPDSLEIGTSYNRYQDDLKRDARNDFVGVSSELGGMKVTAGYITFFL